jgi:hypothetical protein
MSDETIQQAFTVSSPARLKLSNICGSVDVQPGEDGTISVEATKCLDTGDADRTEVRMTQAEDGGVEVETHFREGWRLLNFSRPCKVDYVVRVPKVCNLKGRCVSSMASVQGLQGDLDIASVSGEVTVKELSGSVKIDTVSGDVVGEKVSGVATLKTVSGQVRLSDSQLASVEGSTVSGDMLLQIPLSDGPYRFHSVSGSVRLVVPADTHCTAEISSVSGRVTTALPLTSHHRSNGKHVAEVQGGGVKVCMNSISGNLWIGLPEGEQSAPPPGQPNRPSRAEVLDRIDRGEITVEEGLAQLNQ